MKQCSEYRSRSALIFAMLTVCWFGLLLAWAPVAYALESKTYFSHSVSAKLITAQNGVTQTQSTLSAALHVTLKEDWKTYWRSPGEVGLPPSFNWDASSNIEDVQVLWPAPTRFRAFGIENFGYAKGVSFPLHITLKNPGEPAQLKSSVNLLVCSDVCIPEVFDLTLDLPQAEGIDSLSARRISKALEAVPTENQADSFDFVQANVDIATETLVAHFESDTGFTNPDVFPELGQSTFGPPEIMLADDNKTLRAKFRIREHDGTMGGLRLTLTNGAQAATFDAPSTPMDMAPFQSTPVAVGYSILWVALLAFVGGLILNVMPCVLPVLSIKLASAIKSQAKSAADVRSGFLASALGVLAFMWVLAAGLVIAKSFGHSVGWGMQFQSSYFLIFVVVLLVVFAANMVGVFEFVLPQSVTSKMIDGERSAGWMGDFLTGAFAALLATPCSAPFLGTAVAFALSGSAGVAFVVFTALGLGLALPYIIFALFPGAVQYLPKPGQWMVTLKIILGGLLLITALWLISVLITVAGLWVALCAFAVGLLTVLVLWRVQSFGAGLGGLIAGLALAFALPMALPAGKAPIAKDLNTADLAWVDFETTKIPALLAQGQTVFVDVTADWCLTCKANKTLVMTRDPVLTELSDPGTTAIKADWTKPSDTITRYLNQHNRFGIPFNIVYGPNAPDGIPLPEVLTADLVMQALKQARGE